MCSIPSAPSSTSCSTLVTNAKRTKVSPPPFPGFHVRDLRGVNIVQHMPHSLSKLLGQQEIVRKATPGGCVFLSHDVLSQTSDRRWEGEWAAVTTCPGGCISTSWSPGWSESDGLGSALLPPRVSSRTCPSPTSSCGWGCCYQDNRWTTAGRLTISYLTSLWSVERPSHSLTITFFLIPRGLFILIRYL